MNRRNIIKGGVAAAITPLTAGLTQAEPTLEELLAAMNPDTRQDYENMGMSMPNNDEIKEYLLSKQTAGLHFDVDHEMYSWNNLDFSHSNNIQAGKYVERLLDSKEFDRLLKCDWISVQPMSGPVGLAMGWSRDVDGSILIEKTCVEAGSRHYQLPCKYKKTKGTHIFDLVYSELKERRKAKGGGDVIYCPYIILTNSGRHRYGVVDNLHGRGLPNS